ncbi:MAG: fumarylacetoacetate hydrolase family protein [Anaerolineaceae bacterium]|nr:fumarylacetoacetate hydrolase family protein [Anaerolineaceae bacterium]
MRIVRFKTKLEKAQYGWVYQDSLGLIQGDPFGEFRRFEPEFKIADLELLVPCEPSKIIAIGKNYPEHAAELNSETPQIPMVILKAPSSLIASGEPIILPPQSNEVDLEGELAIVIGKKSRWLMPEEAGKAIFGYTIANDVTARDLQRLDTQWARSKSFDSFCPVGPWIETEFDPSDAIITSHINNSLKQMSSTREMVFDPFQLVLYLSTIMTLNPGDLILTGTPAGVSPLTDGDTVSIHIDGIGSLINPVQSEKTFSKD